MFDISAVDNTYDNLSNKVKADLDHQYNIGRLTGSDYANVYAQLMGTILQLAFQTPEKDKQIQVQEAQRELVVEQTEVAKKQAKAYDQNIQLKLFKSQMDTWGVMFGSGMLSEKPSIISNDQVSSLYQQIKNSIR